MYDLFLQAKYFDVVNSARGRGTMCAIDCQSVELRTKLITTMMNKGMWWGLKLSS